MLTRKHLFASLLALGATQAQPTIKRDNTIQWTACAEDIGIPAECGTLAVPLDYSNEESSPSLNIAMLKVKAVKEPFKGSVLVNPGGPGNDAQSFLTTDGPYVLEMTGGHFDIIGIDPRCFTPQDRIFAASIQNGALDANDKAVATNFAGAKAFALNCAATIGDHARFVGTASTARDFMKVVDALGEDGMLRYWGQSYGTVLGATLAAMFPDRIDKMMLDGVADPEEFNDGWEYSNLGVGELSLKKFIEACVEAGKESCSLASKGESAEEIYTVVEELIASVHEEPLVMGPNVTTDIVRSYDIATSIDGALRASVVVGPFLSAYLTSLLDRNYTTYNVSRVAINGPVPLAVYNADPTIAIRCADSTYRTNSVADLQSRTDRLVEGSRIFGGIYGAAYILCAAWPEEMNGVAPYTGDFVVKTNNPVLIVGSPYDARTPFKNAVALSEKLEGSVALQHNGLGHCVLYSPGQCAIKAMADYFTNGTMPEEGTVCEQDFGPFDGKTFADSFGLGNETVTA